MHAQIPTPSLKRLCKIYSLLEEREKSGETTISSKKIAENIGCGSPSVRKDISLLGEIGTIGAGYEISKLKSHIAMALGLNLERRTCVVGLGKLGRAILQSEQLFTSNFKIVAGFDSNINLLETIVTNIPVYPTCDMTEIISNNAIELAILSVREYASREILDRLINGGIRGIINLTSAHLPDLYHEKVFISTIDIIGECRYLSARFTLEYTHG